MKWGVVTFPGSLDDRDTQSILSHVLGQQVVSLWHKDHDLAAVDCVVLPGGFSYGDYLRCGAIARFSPLMQEIVRFAGDGGLVLGICNGFQVLCESGLLPGALVRNRSLSYVCRDVYLHVEGVANPFTNLAVAGEVWRIPVKHGEGCYVADEATIEQLERDGQIVVRYCRADGSRGNESAEVDERRPYNPNGSTHDIAGITNARRNVFGLMPHPEHAADPALLSATRTTSTVPDGLKIFRSIANWIDEARAGDTVASSR